MTLFRRHEIVRLKVGVKDAALIPDSAELIVDLFLFDIYFEMEQVVEKGGLFGTSLKRGEDNADKNAKKDRELKRQKNVKKPGTNESNTEAGNSSTTGIEGRQQMLGGALCENVLAFQTAERVAFDKLVQMKVERKVAMILQAREEGRLREKLLAAPKGGATGQSGGEHALLAGPLPSPSGTGHNFSISAGGGGCSSNNLSGEDI